MIAEASLEETHQDVADFSIFIRLCQGDFNETAVASERPKR
jgi:hypothetical protein